MGRGGRARLALLTGEGEQKRQWLRGGGRQGKLTTFGRDASGRTWDHQWHQTAQPARIIYAADNRPFGGSRLDGACAHSAINSGVTVPNMSALKSGRNTCNDVAKLPTPRVNQLKYSSQRKSIVARLDQVKSVAQRREWANHAYIFPLKPAHTVLGRSAIRRKYSFCSTCRKVCMHGCVCVRSSKKMNRSANCNILHSPLSAIIADFQCGGCR